MNRAGTCTYRLQYVSYVIHLSNTWLRSTSRTISNSNRSTVVCNCVLTPRNESRHFWGHTLFSKYVFKPRLRIRSSILEERISTTILSLCPATFHQTFAVWCNLGVYKETHPFIRGTFEQNEIHRTEKHIPLFLPSVRSRSTACSPSSRPPLSNGSPASLLPLFLLTLNMRSLVSISAGCSWISSSALSAPMTEGDRYYQDQILLGNEVGQVHLRRPSSHE